MCDRCRQPQPADGVAYIYTDAFGTVLARLCLSCHGEVQRKNPRIEHRPPPVTPIEVPSRPQCAAMRKIPGYNYAGTLIPSTGIRCRNDALKGHPRNLCRIHDPVWTPADDPVAIEAIYERRRAQQAEWVAKNPQRHTCPDCKFVSYRLSEHDKACSAKFSADNDVEYQCGISAESAFGIARSNVRWNSRGEQLICGRLTHHRPMDMSPADVFGWGIPESA